MANVSKVSIVEFEPNISPSNRRNSDLIMPNRSVRIGWKENYADRVYLINENSPSSYRKRRTISKTSLT